MITLHELWAAIDLAMRTGVDPNAPVEFFVTRNPNAASKDGPVTAKFSSGPDQTKADGMYEHGVRATFFLEEK